VEINREKAVLLGVSTRNIGQTLQLALSGTRFGYFVMNGKQYQVLGQFERPDRSSPVDLKSIAVRNNEGRMIQLDNLVTLKEESSPPQLFHYNRYMSATVSAGLVKGKTIGQGIAEMDRIAEHVLDDTFSTALTGNSQDFAESSSSLLFAFAPGTCAYLPCAGRPVRKFPRSADHYVHGSPGLVGSADFPLVF